MKLFLVGDVHGNFDYLVSVVNNIHEFAPDSMIVQVGDFGFYNRYKDLWTKPKMPVHFIDGNHEEVPELLKYKAVTEVWPNAFYIPRGTRMRLGEKNVLFHGGAESVDFKFRTKGIDFFTEERVEIAAINEVLRDKSQVDLLITHTPPKSCIDANFDPGQLAFFGLSRTWYDHSANAIDVLWKELGCPPTYCGHMHRALQWNSVRILDINEILDLTI